MEETVVGMIMASDRRTGVFSQTLSVNYNFNKEEVFECGSTAQGVLLSCQLNSRQRSSVSPLYKSLEEPSATAPYSATQSRAISHVLNCFTSM